MSEKSEKQSEAMSTAALNEASDLLRELAGNRKAGESIKAVLRRVHRPLKDWSASRVRAIWYRDPRVKIRGGEIDQLRALANSRTQMKAGLNELEQLRGRIARLERLLGNSDEAFHSETLAALGHQRRQMG